MLLDEQVPVNAVELALASRDARQHETSQLQSSAVKPILLCYREETTCEYVLYFLPMPLMFPR